MISGVESGLEKLSINDEEEEDFSSFMQTMERKKEVTAKDTRSELDSVADDAYSYLLARIFQKLQTDNPHLLGEKGKHFIEPPMIHKEGNRKTILSNIKPICTQINRDIEHVIQYLCTEFGTSTSIDAKDCLIIKGKYQSKQIESVLRKYILEYVCCLMCKSLKTILSKQNKVFMIECKSCGSTRSVQGIKMGFKAQTERRSATKNNPSI